MQKPETMKDYHHKCQESLDNDFLRAALDTFAVSYRAGRQKAFSGYDTQALIADVSSMKDETLNQLDELYEQFKQHAEAAGATVHYARTAEEANRIICHIARQTKSEKIIKSKSMTAEEIHLNKALENEGFNVVETDLGEWIIQLRHEGPSHMVMPAIHLSRFQVRDLFTDVTGSRQEEDIDKLVKVARRELRQKFIDADMGITGANFAIAETGTIGLVTNEGNARLVTTLPRVHVALMGIDKLVPSVDDALKILKVLPRNATGQQITSYVTWITGATACTSEENGFRQTHYVLLDNGRRTMAEDPLISQVFRCVRCGACANVCPVYRIVGGHKMGHIYIGAIGLILTYFFHGTDKARNLVQNCINCEACKDVCAGGIDLPRIIKEVHRRIQDEEGHPLPSLLLGRVLKNRKLFHTLLKTAKWAQRPVQGNEGFMRHLPMLFFKEHDFKALPNIADVPFRELWPKIKPQVSAPRLRIGLFSGCVQDFVYPEQMVAAVNLFARHDVEMVFPQGQSCCGLPVQMMGELNASREVARDNIAAFRNEKVDYIVTLCASCGSHMKHTYPLLLQDDEKQKQTATEFSSRIIDFSSFVHDVLQLENKDFSGDGTKATFHSPCHLCRGLGVHDAPQDLITAAGMEFIRADEQETCCGFGGTYSAKFPELSAQILAGKLDDFEKTGADLLLTDCPGCIMQLRGGLKLRNSAIKVQHTAEALAERSKK